MSTDNYNRLVNRGLLLFVLLLLPVVHGCWEKSKTVDTTTTDAAKQDVLPHEATTDAAEQYQYPFKNIIEAAEKGTVKDIKYFLEQGATVNEKGVDGESLILIAVDRNPDIEVLKYLIEQGVDVNVKTDYGVTPLHHVVWIHEDTSKFHIEKLKYLIEQGADVNAKTDHGQTPLHHHEAFSNIEKLKYLIEKGVDVNAKDGSDVTPLHHAARFSNSNIEALKYLIEMGADVNAKDKNGYTPLDYLFDHSNDDDSYWANKKKEILREAGGKRGHELSE